MLKLERDKLLIAAVLIVVVSIDMINTSMLAPVLPNIPNVVPFFAVLLLAMRFAYIHHYSISYLIFAPILLFAGGMVYYKTGNLNALMYMFLLVFLYKAEMESVLKIYSVVALFFIVLIVFLAVIGAIPNLQFVQSRSAGVVVRNSFGFIYPTDFASHCFYLFIAWGYLLREKYIFIRTIVGLSLAFFILKFCDARLNALSVLAATLIFIIMYYTKEREFKVYSIMPYFALIFSTFMFYVSYFFTWSSSFYVNLNNLFSMRLFLGKNALDTYGLPLFGKAGVKFIGYGGTTESVHSYNYVDSSYIQMLFYYGLIPVVLLVLIYVFASKKVHKQKKYLFLALLSLITINCMIEAFWIRPGYNIFMFTIFANLYDIQNKEKREVRL